MPYSGWRTPARAGWLATFDIFTVAQRDPEVRAAAADGLEDGRRLWARLLYAQLARGLGAIADQVAAGLQPTAGGG